MRRSAILIRITLLAQSAECLSGTLRDPIRGHCQAGSLTGAVHLSNTNAGVLRLAPSGQKPGLEQKGKCQLDLRRSVNV
jgi:hypothetical protein